MSASSRGDGERNEENADACTCCSRIPSSGIFGSTEMVAVMETFRNVRCGGSAILVSLGLLNSHFFWSLQLRSLGGLRHSSGNHPFGKYQKMILGCDEDVKVCGIVPAPNSVTIPKPVALLMLVVLIAALVFLPAVIPGSFHGFNQVFLAAKFKHYWCSSAELSQLVPNSTERQWYLPLQQDKQEVSQCTMYNSTREMISLSPASDLSMWRSSNFSVVSCQNGWEYNRTEFYYNSIVSEWNLVCDKQTYPTIALICLMMGATFGTPFFGFIADRWGRKRAYFICICVQLCGGITTGFAHNFVMFCVCRFVVGATYPSSWSLPFTLGMELITPKYRAAFATAASISYNLGALIVVGIAYWIQNWREFALATCVPLSYVFIFWCFMPESPRWLLTRKRVAEVQTFLFKVARCNGTRFEPLNMEHMMKHDRDWDNVTKTKNYTYLDLVRLPNLRKKTLLLSFINCANLSVYLGLSYYSPSLGSNSFLSYTLASLVEIPAYLFVFITANFLGRRLPTVGCLLAGGSTLLVAAFLPKENPEILLALTLVGKLCISAAFTFGEIYEQELFPTVVRSQGASLTQNISNAVACVFPLVNYLGENYISYPIIIFGGFCVLAGFSALFLPETLGADLPQTLQDGEDFGRNMTWRDVFRILPEYSPRKEFSQVLSNRRLSLSIRDSPERKPQKILAPTTNLLADSPLIAD